MTGRRDPSPAAPAPALGAGLLAGLLVLILLTNRFALPLGPLAIQAALPLALPVVALGLWRGWLRLDPARLAAFALGASALLACTVARADGLSLPSLALMLVLYAAFALRPARPAAAAGTVLAAFRGAMTVLAAAGVAQYLLQWAVPGATLFTFEGLVPDALLRDGANTVIPIHYGASILRSNGMVFAEPSGFSQHVALALLVELLFFGARWRLALYAAALLVAYSGTGMLLAALFGLPAALVGRRIGLGGLALMALPAAALGLALVDWAALLARIDEFGSTGSSGFARFLSPFWILRDFIIDRPGLFLTGAGPGSVERFLSATWYESHDPTWAKLMIEYGAIGTAAFAVFFGYAILAGARTAVLPAAAAFAWAFLGGGLLSPNLVLTLWLLLIVGNRPTAAAAPRAAPLPAAPPPPPALFPAAVAVERS